MKFRTVGSHALFWMSVYALWIFIFRSYSVAVTKTMTIQFCYLIFITADFYLIYLLIAPHFLAKKRMLAFVALIAFTIAFSSLLRSFVAVLMKQYFFHDASFSSFSELYLSSLLDIAGWVMLITLSKMIIDRQQMGRQLELLQKERIENELNFLKAQINPHALFNSLNTIYGYIDKKNQPARKILLQYSELLRYQLYDCAAEKVRLDKEIFYIKNYIAFERLRKDEGLVVQVNMDNVDPDLIIAPLMLIVLVENAFKFVSNFSNEENKIRINIHSTGNVLYCSVINTKEKLPAAARNQSKGIGIQNLKRRLELLYAGSYDLTIQAGDHLYQTDLTIQLT